MQPFETFVQVLRARATEDSSRRVFTFLEDGERNERAVTFGELDALARLVAAELQATCKPGARIVLLYPPGIDYIAAFFGCLYGGFVAVPAYPPDPSRLARTLPRLHAIISDAQADVVLTTSMIASMTSMLAATAPQLTSLRWIATDAIDIARGQDWKPVRVDGSTLAFLQYTSGSTGTPKGVMLSHANLIANERSIQGIFKLDRAESVGVGWLPLYHDMGLIGNVLQTVFVGFHCALMSPLDFLQRPFRWLDALSRFGGTVSGGPNFAYDLCVRKISAEERASLDLSRWRLAFSGAEPVRRESLDRFAERFAECGFRREAFLPCYGLAEATLLVTGKPMGTDYRTEHVDAKHLEEGRAEVTEAGSGSREIISCGVVPEGCTVRVVDPKTRCGVDDGRVGELWVAGDHVATGYWNDEAKSREVFGATLEGDEAKTPYLRTGDLAFVHDGEIFICGRLKDLIVVRGRNYYPQDIERVAEASTKGIRRGGTAAFSIDDGGEERVVLVAEHARSDDEHLEALFEAVRSAVSEDAQLAVHAVVLVRSGSIPKTSSGKIQRHAAKAAFLEGTLDVVAQSVAHGINDGRDTESDAPELPELGLEDVERARLGVLEQLLATEIARALRTAPATIDLAAPVTSLGLDSLMAIDVTHAIERRLGIELPVTMLMRGETGRAVAEVVAARLRDKRAGTSEEATRGAASASSKLSAGQEALYFLQDLTGEVSAYNVGAAFTIRGRIDVPALEGALRALIGANDALTASFSRRERQVVQTWDRGVADRFELGQRDAAALDKDALEALVGDEVYKPFDLERGPVFRATLLTRSGDEHVLVLAAHHIACDLWSLVGLLAELRTAYITLHEGKPLAALARRASYGEFVQWQERYLAERAEQDWGYWKGQVTDAPALDLPTDKPRPSVQGYGGAAAPLSIPDDLVTRATALAKEEGTTLYVVLLACFELLLARTTGQRRFVVGAPAAGRPSAAFERTAGYFVNPMPLSADLEGDPTGRALVTRVRGTVLGGLEHQHFPFASVVDRSGAGRDPSRSPVFQALFVLEKAFLDESADLTMLALGARSEPVRFAGLAFEHFGVGKRTERFDVTLSLAHGEGAVRGAIEYNTTLFEPATASRMASHFLALLDALTARPDAVVSELDMMSADERRLLLEHARGPSAGPTPARAASAIFCEAAERHRDALAVSDGVRELTYGQLLESARSIASMLVELHGVTVETRVLTCLPRSCDLIVADLATWLAGGAFVPTDAAFPTARICAIAEDSGARVILTTRAIAERLQREPSWPSGCAIVVVDEGAARGGRGGESGFVPRDVHPAAAAYVVYTSGTTGKPKGVVIEHRQLVRMARWVERHYALTSADRLSQTAAAAFDASVFEIVPPLLVGASLHIIDDETRRAPDALVDRLDALGITICFAPTPLAEKLLAEKRWSTTKLRYLLSGGDRLTRRPDRHHPFVLINGYGPSECTVQATVAAVSRDEGGRPPTIGKPIDGVSVYVLGPDLRPVPMGVVGEVFIGGSNVGRGYAGQPSLTAERFLPDPFADAGGARMYRSGDLARVLDNGELEFRGRADHQVKIHGQRVELGEIEAVLARQADVAEAVVLAQELSGRRKRLVAFVSERSPEARPDADVLVRALRHELPESMVPSAVVVLSRLPLTHNGKVDRNALLAITPTPMARTASTDDLESKLCSFAAEVVGADHFDAKEMFFEAGLSSLDLTTLRKKVESELGIALPLAMLFEYPSIAAIAPHIRSLLDAQEETAPVSGAAPRAGRVARREDAAPIAIVAMTGRFPGAADVGELWRRSASAADCITRFEASEASPSPLVPEGPAHPRFRGAEGVVSSTGTDPELWRPAADTRGLDLQSRLFVDSVLALFEEAGYDPWSLDARVALYGGASPIPLVEALVSRGLGKRGSALWALGTMAPDTLPMRAAHIFGFRGEAMYVNTACSTGLSAVHLACESLRAGSSDLAIAIAANVPEVQRTGYVYDEGTILSADGVVRPFDADASGVVLGHGVAAVLLKPLDAAVADGDRIFAVIRSTATNNDGRSKVAYTAPSVRGQAEVIEAAQRSAGVSARDIEYVETHGTGTRLGDPVELSALTTAFRRSTDERGFCALGAVKANIGHLDSVAGLAGLVKTALALHHETIPPLAHFRTPNPELGLPSTPFYVPTEAHPWPRRERPRRAGVSSFGIGGTNVHAVLEEAPSTAASSVPSRDAIVLSISARTSASLEELAERVAARIESAPVEEACDVAYTLNTRRLTWPHRRAVVGTDGASLAAALRTRASSRTNAPPVRAPAFVFAGMGASAAGAGTSLYAREPVFRAVVDRCQAALGPAGYDVVRALTNAGRGEALPVGLAAASLFTFEMATTELLASWGIVPSLVIGHSFGEYAALTASGAITLDDALEVVRVRCEVMDAMPEGAMLVALCPEDVAEELAQGGGVELAVVNGPRGVVFSGSVERIDSLRATLRKRRIATVPLSVTRALHTSDVDAGLPRLAEAFDAAAVGAPRTPFLSTVTAALEGERLMSGAYWAEQMRRRVRFADAVRNALDMGTDAFVEIGPTGGLTAPMAEVVAGACPVLHALDASGDSAPFYALVAAMVALETPIDWRAWYGGEHRARVDAPIHPRPDSAHGESGFTASAASARAATPLDVPAPAPVTSPLSTTKEPTVTATQPTNNDATIQARIVDLWKAALHLDSIDPKAHFLELGGSSLLAVQLVADMREAFGVDIGLAEVFAAPTVEDLAALIAHHAPATAPLAPIATAPAPPSEAHSRAPSGEGSTVLSAVQRRVLAAHRDEAWPTSVLNMAGAVRLRGALDVASLAHALRDVVRRHEGLHTRIAGGSGLEHALVHFRASDVQLTSVWCDSATREEDRIAEVRAAIADRIDQRFDLTREIPIRAFLFHVGPNDHVLAVVVHHLSMDAPSLKVLFQDTIAGLLGVSPGAAPRYTDFATRQRAEIDSDEGRKHAAWQRGLVASSRRLGSLLSKGGARRADTTLRLELGPEIGRAVDELKKQRGVSTFVAIASAVATVFAELLGTSELVLSTPFGNRDRAGHAALVGYVAHCMLMPLDVASAKGSSAGVLGEVARAFGESLRHASVPFEHVALEHIGTGAPPFSDVCLVVHEELEQGARVGDLVVEPFAHESPVVAQPPVWAATMGTIGFLVHWRPAGDGGRVTFCYPRDLLADAAREVPRRVLAALEAQLVRSTSTPEVAWSAPSDRPRAPLALRLDGIALGHDEIDAAVAETSAALEAAGVGTRAFVDVVAESRAELLVCARAVLARGAKVTVGRRDTKFVLSAKTLDASIIAGRHAVVAKLDLPSSRPRPARVDANAAPVGSGEIAAAKARIAKLASGPRAHVVWDDAVADNRALALAIAALEDGGLVSEMRVVAPSTRRGSDAVPLSLAYFPVDEERYGSDTYRLLIEGAKAGDDGGLRGLFVPERHFHPFGGTFPDPLVAAAALAAVTKRIELRAGSLVLPLHDPVRVAESWGMVDVLSGGRVGLSIATGWRAEDFVLAPGRFAHRKEELKSQLQTLRALWRGETTTRLDPNGKAVKLRTRPRPLQPELPVWLTCSSSPASYALAGELGCAVFTMVATDHDALRMNIATYREAFAAHWGGATGHVTVLTSTFVDHDGARARRVAMPALERYMSASLDIGVKASTATMPEAARRAIVTQKAERVCDHDGIIGDIEESRRRITRLAAIGADEIACLIDFGVDVHEAVAGVSRIVELSAQAPASSRRWARLPAPAPLEHRELHEVWLVSESSADGLGDAPHRSVLVDGRDLRAVTGECCEEHALSTIQLGVYFDELRFARPTYNNPFLVRSTTPLDPERLEDAIEAACRRHDMLRSRFVHKNETVLRVVDAEPRVDLRVSAQVATEPEIVTRAREESCERFDLGRQHPLRVHLYSSDDGASYLMLLVHHIAGDVVSGFVVLRDIMTAYGALPHDAFAATSPPPSYADVLAERAKKAREREERLMRWVAQVDGMDPVVEWPTAKTRPERMSGHGAELSRVIDQARVERIRKAAAKSRVTVPSFLFSALGALLHLKTGKRDVIVGSVTLGRNNPAWLEVVGPFFNMLPVRSSAPPGTTFEQLAQRTSQVLMHAMVEDEVGVAEIVQKTGTPTTMNRAPLVQFLFNYIPKQGVGDGDGAGIEQIDVDWGIATFDVDVTARERGDGLLLSVKFSTDALAESEARSLLEAFDRLVDVLTDNPRTVLVAEAGDGDRARAAAVWSEQLTDVRRRVALDAGDASAPTSGSRDRVAIDAPLAASAGESQHDRLVARAREVGVDVDSLYLAAWIVLLERHSGQSDLVVGEWSTAQSDPLTAAVGGSDMVTPLRITLNTSWSTGELAQAIAQARTRALELGPIPAHALFGHGSSAGDAAVGFVVEGAATPAASALPHPISLALVRHGAGRGATLVARGDTFAREALDAMASRFEALVESIADDPTRVLSALSMLPASDAAKLDMWNATHADYPRGTSVHALVAAQAARTPLRVAVVDDVVELTYGELDARAERLGGRLRDAGAGPGMRVAVAIPRGASMVVALLAIQKSGAAYVPIDLTLPRERVATMLEDAEVTHVVTDSDGASVLPTERAMTVVRGDVDEAPSRPASQWPDSAASGERSTAYVMFTSGSTGRPKGVAVPQRALVNFLASMQKTPGILESDVLLAVTTLSFDISGLEVYLPLVSGARLVIASREAAQDGYALASLVTRHSVTVMQATPTTYQLMLAAGWEGAPGMKVLVGGEAVPERLATDLVQRCASVWNMYGPTETTIWSTCARLDGTRVVIGRPIANTDVHVLGPSLERMPIGVKGELYIGGDGLADGYFGRPELTAERFVERPFGTGGRLYRTGDIARVLPDGNVECFGRIDAQVKLRGFRIELGEIEHVLTRIPSVKAGVVLLLDGGSAAGPRLVAFVVGRSRTKELVTSELADEMKRSLPVYMVPSVFVVLDALPLNASGKIDRKALAATDFGERAGSQADFESPEGDLEAVISQIWSEVLGVSKVGRNDNFFDLGGHSLLAMQVHGKLMEKLGKEFPILNLFSYTTVASLAGYLSGMDSSGTDDSRDTQLERGAARLALRRQRRRRSEG